MLGAICGDILGSTYEIESREEVSLLNKDDHFTDDAILTCAIAEWCLSYSHCDLEDEEHMYLLAYLFRDYSMKYKNAHYGCIYADWVMRFYAYGKIPDASNSYGNGCAMRVTPIAYAFDTLEKVEHYAKVSAKVTHNNSEGIRGACAIAAATKMALDGNSKTQIKKYIEERYFYDLSKSLDDIKMKENEFSATCQITVPQAIIAFFEGNDYEDTIVKAIGIGGDSDTVAAMAGGIAYAYWKKIPKHIIEHCLNTLSSEMKRLVEDFSEKYIKYP